MNEFQTNIINNNTLNNNDDYDKNITFNNDSPLFFLGFDS